MHIRRIVQCLRPFTQSANLWDSAMTLMAKLAGWITWTHHSWVCVSLLQTEGKQHPKQDYPLMSELKFVGVKTKTAHQHFMSLFYPWPKLTSLSPPPPPLSRFYDALQWRLERLRWMMPVNDMSLLASVFGCLFKTKRTPAVTDRLLIYSCSRDWAQKVMFIISRLINNEVSCSFK